MELTTGLPHHKPGKLGRLAWKARSLTKFPGSRLKSRSPASPRPGWPVALVVASLFALSGCNPDRSLIAITEHPSNRAKGQLYGNVRYWNETQFINGEWNHGFTATVTVRNVGQTGFIKVTVYLKCSEGEWSRSEEIPLCAGEYRTLTYFFHEPTHHGANVECRATVSP
jgi:hypothetical protein